MGTNGLQAKTILAENDYISKYYLQDFATYYAFCFERYSKICKRIHFFSIDVDQKAVSDRIIETKQELDHFWDSYLGFIVVKPIPITVIGYTVLKTYNQDEKIVAKYVSNLFLKKIINAYSPIGIPIILILQVPNGETHGLHAITVSGHKQKQTQFIKPRPHLSLVANDIERIYAHDDQWGPFARINFIKDIELETPWTTGESHKNSTLVTNIIVPVYPKIRISYEDIEIIVLGLNAILTLFFNNKLIADLVWDIKIDYSENYKKKIKKSPIEPDEKLLLLMRSLPKYIWIADCYVAEYKILEFTFDATDVNNGMIGEDIICYLPKYFKIEITKFLHINRDKLHQLFLHRNNQNYYNFLSNKLKP